MIEYILVFVAMVALVGALTVFVTAARRSAATTGELMGADVP